MLIATSFFLTFDAYAESDDYKIVHALIPHDSDAVTFDTWIASGTMDKANATSTNDGDTTYIFRASDSKWQTFILENATAGENPVLPETSIIQVQIFALVKNDGTKSGDVSVGCETGKSNKDIYDSSTFEIEPSSAYEEITFNFTQNPATKPLREWMPDDVDDWIIDGKQLACGIKNQDRQNLAPIFVTEFGARIFFDSTPPVIIPIISGTQGDDEWYISNVTLGWSITDPQSPITYIDPTCDEKIISAESTGMDHFCTARSGGGESTNSTNIKLDKTPPVITLPDDVPDPKQASTPDGEIMTFGNATAEDLISLSPTIATCEPGSGSLFPIGFNDVECWAVNGAGLNSSDFNPEDNTFVVQVNPYLAINFTTAIDGNLLMEKWANLTVADPWINRNDTVTSIQVNITSSANTEDDSATLLLTLNANATNPDIYEGQILMSSGNTDENIPLLHVDPQSIVNASYPYPNDSRTSWDAVTTSGAAGSINPDKIKLQWDNDVYAIGDYAGIDQFAKNCGSTIPNDTRLVNITSGADPVGFLLNLTETAQNCFFSSPQIRLDSSSTDASIPQIHVSKALGVNFVTVSDSPSPVAGTPLGTYSHNSIIIKSNAATPSGGLGLLIDKTVANYCGLGNDNDFDGLCNSWETPFGLEIPFNGVTYNFPCKPLIYDTKSGGGISIPANATTDCPDPDFKDIYLEIDYMVNHRPDLLVLQDVLAVFKNAPVDADGDGTDEGIRLHIVVDEKTGVHDEFITLTEFYQTKNATFGTVAERGAGTATDIDRLGAKRQAYHWMYNVHSQDANKLSSGYSEVHGNDFLVSMGPFVGHTGTIKQHASTIVHELGHNLDLNHGGAGTNTQNCKPNYISVMNYVYQFDKWTSNPIDFSTVKNVDINENNPDELVGMAANNGLEAAYGPKASGVLTVTLGVDTPIDWNRVGGIANPSTVTNINHFPIPGCEKTQSGYAKHDTLTGYNDYLGMDLDFRDQGTFANGIASFDPLGDGELDQGNTESNSTSISLIPEDGERPIPYPGDEFTNATSIERDEGEIMELTSYSYDPDTIDPSKTATPPGVMWNLNYPINAGIFDDPGIDAWGSPSLAFLDDDESGGANNGTDTFTVGLRVNDLLGNQNEDDATLDITIRNVAPNVTAALNATTINEGDSVELASTTFTDPGIFDCGKYAGCSATIDWDDGNSGPASSLEYTNGTAPQYDPENQIFTSDLILTTGTVYGAHTYLDDDSYSVTVSVEDKDKGVGSNATPVMVNNVDPTLNADIAQSIIIGDNATFSASFSDPGTLDTWNATVNYGDGSPILEIDPITLGDIDIPDYNYTDPGAYNVTITVNDDDGGSDHLQGTVLVGLDFEGDSPIIEPIDNSAVNEGRTLPVNAQFLNSAGNSIDSLTVGVWVDDLTNADPEFDGVSSQNKVKNNIADWNDSSLQYEFKLDTSGYNTNGELGALHAIIIKVFDSNNMPFISFNQTVTVNINQGGGGPGGGPK